jgi:asparagine synthase (glutamine-hydrolysing)
VEKANESELKERAKHLLRQAVKGQLISDVPLGIFLSGGIDSTIVAGLAKEVSDSVKTYTVIFEGQEFQYYNEQVVARAISRHLDTEHHEIMVPPTELWPMLDLLDYFDQPFGNPTFYLMYLVSKYSREQVTVALCGAGGDELYAGYPRYHAIRLARRVGWVPWRLWRVADRALHVFRDTGRTPLLRRARQFVSGMQRQDMERFARWTYFMGTAEKKLLFDFNAASTDFNPSARVLSEAFNASPLAEEDNRWLHTDLKTFLVDNLLEYTDKMSMAASLESRVPLLDQEFVEFSLNVPFRFKLSGRRSKILLRDAFFHFLPPEAQKAPKKGFNAPLSHWMRGALDDYFEASQMDDHPLKDALGEDIGRTWRCERLLDWSYIQLLRHKHRDGKADYSYELFSILVFDLWWRKYVSRSLEYSPRFSALGS